MAAIACINARQSFGVLAFFAALCIASSAWSQSDEGQSNPKLYTFDVELFAHNEREGPVLVRVLEGYPARITTPSGRVIVLTLDETQMEDRVLTTINSRVRVTSDEDFIILPKMFVSGLGEVSLSPRGVQREAGLERLKITFASVETPDDAEYSAMLANRPCDAANEGSGGGDLVTAGVQSSSCCEINCSGGNDSGPWSCCGDAVTCCCNASGGCCSPQPKVGF